MCASTPEKQRGEDKKLVTGYKNQKCAHPLIDEME